MYLLLIVSCEEEEIYVNRRQNQDKQVLRSYLEQYFVDDINLFFDDEVIKLSDLVNGLEIIGEEGKLGNLDMTITRPSITPRVVRHVSIITELTVTYLDDQLKFDMVDVNGRKRQYLYLIIELDE